MSRNNGNSLVNVAVFAFRGGVQDRTQSFRESMQALRKRIEALKCVVAGDSLQEQCARCEIEN